MAGGPAFGEGNSLHQAEFHSELNADMHCWTSQQWHPAGLPEGAVVNDEGCPFQIRGLCTARERRPLGCRVYFCDPAYAGHAERLTEKYLAELKTLHNSSGEPWDYRPLIQHLRRWCDDSVEKI